MDHLLVVSLLLLWSSGLQAEEKHNKTESVRLLSYRSRCNGQLEVHKGDWKPVDSSYFTLRDAAVVCRALDCGSAIYVSRARGPSKMLWKIKSECLQSGSALNECVTLGSSSRVLSITCVDSVRLVNGTSLCSGRLEVKSDQSWSSVCEADFDHQDAPVVCRELGCGPPLVFQGGLYGEVETSLWTKEFQCAGYEFALRDCRTSGSTRNTCSPGTAVGLTCSEPVRLVGGQSRCAGTLEVKRGQWGPVSDLRHGPRWTLKDATAACRELGCGSAVSLGLSEVPRYTYFDFWMIKTDCVRSGSVLRECVETSSFSHILNLTCSDSVRLVNGTSLCSGRLEVKSNQSDQSWSPVCEADFDHQYAEVVCRELGCGPPLVFQGGLYGEVETSLWTKEFQCAGYEFALQDCRTSGSTRNTCSPATAVGLTCSEPVRLVGGQSRCAGTLEVKQGQWRPVRYFYTDWSLKEMTVVCKELGCGSAVYLQMTKQTSDSPVWAIRSDWVQSGSALRECVTLSSFSTILELACSDVLVRPIISVSTSAPGVSVALQVFRGSAFTITCSIHPQYPGGTFVLAVTSSSTTRNYTQPAVNHTARFPFPAAEPGHEGNYSCVYGVYAFSHDFSSASRRLSLAVSDHQPTALIIRAVVLLLALPLLSAALYFCQKASRRRKARVRDNVELEELNLAVPAAGGEPSEWEGALGAE